MTERIQGGKKGLEHQRKACLLETEDLSVALILLARGPLGLGCLKYALCINCFGGMTVQMKAV